jgi:hypothetical protein
VVILSERVREEGGREGGKGGEVMVDLVKKIKT